MKVTEIRKVVKFVCCAEFLRMSVSWTLSLLISHLRLLVWFSWVHKSRTYIRQPVTASVGSRKPLCVITGATSGLGAAAAHALAKEGFFVILIGRSGHLLSKTMSDIRKLNENAQLEAFEVDLSSFASIMKFRDSFQQWLLDRNLHSSIQLLINNAGILATSYRATPDGFDEMMMTNYIGAFCLTKILLPLLIDSPVPSRIVNVSSFTHRNVNDTQADEEYVSGKSFSSLKQYPYARLYGYSKLFMVLFSYELHRKISIKDKVPHLSVNVADPGAVNTNIMREVPSCLSRLAFAVLKFVGLLQYPEEGVSSILDAALSPPAASGMYFFGGRGRTLDSSVLSYDAKLAEGLWWTSCNLFVKLKLAYKGFPVTCTSDEVENLAL